MLKRESEDYKEHTLKSPNHNYSASVNELLVSSKSLCILC
jgi:hypothetical protein